MSKIKVLLLQEVIPPYRVPLFNLIAKNENIDLTVLTFAKYTSNKKEWKNIKLDVKFKLVYLKGFHIEMKNYSYFHINYNLYYQIFKVKPDIIILGGFYFSCLLTTIFNIILRKKIIIWSEATEYTEAAISKIKTKFRKYILSKADGLIVAGSLAKQYLLKLSEKYTNRLKVFTAYNSVDVEFIQNSLMNIGKEVIQKERNKYNKHNLLFIGQLIDRKSIKETIEIFEIVQKKRKDTGLLVLGNGSMKTELEEYCQRRGLNVFFEGFISQENIIKYFAVSDILILLSKYDCNPLVTMEALSCGLPIIASKEVGNTPEFVIDDYNGYCVNREDYQDVSEKILKIIDNGERKELFSKNSLELSKKVNHMNTSEKFIEAINYTYNN